jgi:hypothetical protein
LIKDFKDKFEQVKKNKALLQKMIAEPLINTLLNSAIHITKEYKKLSEEQIEQTKQEFKLSKTAIIEIMILEDLINKIVKKYENEQKRN